MVYKLNIRHHAISIGRIIVILFFVSIFNAHNVLAQTGCNIGSTVYTTQSGSGIYGGTSVPNYQSSGNSYSLGAGLPGCHAEETGYASAYGVCIIDNNNAVAARYITFNIIGCNLDTDIYLLLIGITSIAYIIIRKDRIKNTFSNNLK